jgi:DNA-binding transcriptional LysR family regulator
MDFHQMRAFIAVAEELHFGRAAARIGMAQPPFSRLIRGLEDELDAKLLERTSRRVALTAAGEQLLGDARVLFEQRARAVTAVRRAAAGETGLLRLGFGASAAFGVTPKALQIFRQQHPDVELRLEGRDAAEVGPALLAGDLDVAFVRNPIRHEGVALEHLLADPLVLAMSAVHPRVAERLLTLQSFAEEPFVLFPRRDAPPLHDAIIRLCQDAGFTPRVAHEAQSWLTWVSAVGGGIGVGILSGAFRDIAPRTVVFRELADLKETTDLFIATRTGDASPLVQSFIMAARRCAAGHET